MARIRTIKPEFFTSADITGLTPLSRLFYVSLWCEADREGRLKWDITTLKQRYFPADNCDIGAMADELVEAGLIVIYEHAKKRYADIPSFKLHQVINNREAESVLPERLIDAPFTRESGDSGEGKGKEGKGTKEAEPPKPAEDEPPDSGESALDHKTLIFTQGVEILKRHGSPEATARSFLGKYAALDETKLAGVIGQLMAQPKIEPKAYIVAAMTPKKRGLVL